MNKPIRSLGFLSATSCYPLSKHFTRIKRHKVPSTFQAFYSGWFRGAVRQIGGDEGGKSLPDATLCKTRAASALIDGQIQPSARRTLARWQVLAGWSTEVSPRPAR